MHHKSPQNFFPNILIDITKTTQCLDIQLFVVFKVYFLLLGNILFAAEQLVVGTGARLLSIFCSTRKQVLVDSLWCQIVISMFINLEFLHDQQDNLLIRQKLKAVNYHCASESPDFLKQINEEIHFLKQNFCWCFFACQHNIF